MELTHLGPYELGKIIGKGGMGSVYEAIDTRNDLRVAIKALSPQLAGAEGFRERFESEIESLKTLRHDGIVRLHGYGEQDGVLFYSMELVDGRSLEEELKAGRRFHWREVADIAIQVCRALKHAHDHGVVHRDIKPANILIDDENHVKLADFGIARLFGNTQLTTAGGVLGTADYMSPEQADGRPVTERCDQYSLGGVMYALLAGRTPFRARSLPEMLQLQRFAAPDPLRRFAPDTPEHMEHAIFQLLAKDPVDRFPNTAVLARHLEAMVKALSRPAADDFAVDEHGPVNQAQIGGLDPLLAATRDEHDIDESDAATLRPEDVENSSRLSVDRSAVAKRTDESNGEVSAGPHDPTQASHTANSMGSSAPAETRPATFTTVDDAPRHLDDQASWRIYAVQTVGSAGLLAGLVALVVYLSRPPTADALYATIRAAADEGENDQLRSIDKELHEFLRRFPQDSRAEQVAEIREQATLAKLQRRLELQSRLGNRADDELLPFETHYLRALRLASSQPERAIQILAAVIALYGHDNGGDVDPTGEEHADRRIVCLKLAARKLRELRQQVDYVASQQLPNIQHRLATAAKLAEKNVDEAKAIYGAIIDLYRDQPWAAEMVAEARQRLQE